MTPDNVTRAKLVTVAKFPEQFFLENIAVRGDGSILVTVLNRKELWYIPAPSGDLPVEPMLVHTFDHPAMGIVETELDIFYATPCGVLTSYNVCAGQQ